MSSVRKQDHALQDDDSQVIELKRVIEIGQYKDGATDRDMNVYWTEFSTKLELFKSKFDEWICTRPDDLRVIHNEMNHFIEKVNGRVPIFFQNFLSTLEFSDGDGLAPETKAT